MLMPMHPDLRVGALTAFKMAVNSSFSFFFSASWTSPGMSMDIHSRIGPGMRLGGCVSCVATVALVLGNRAGGWGCVLALPVLFGLDLDFACAFFSLLL
ncbi:hypothetical protein BDV11DRAFT_176501 [Aspergillus similis]